MNKLTLNELFSGIGAQRKALERLKIEFEVVGVSEIDKFAIKSYEAIFGKTFNYGDIREVKELKYADMWTYSFPCTDISVAGRQAGITKETRSGLVFEVGRLLKVAKQNKTLPKFLVLENVKNLVGKKFKTQFDAKGEILDAHGMNEGCERLAKEKSWDIERFSIASVLDFNVVIPKGTRVTGDNEKYFATTEVAVIMAGETSVDVKIEAVEGGEAYNGYETGKLTKLVDMVEYISKVTNLNGTTGGDNGEPYPEEDDGIGDQHYYERIRLSKNSKSTAGAEGLYEYYAKSADASISDVYVDSPSAGEIKITVACKDGAVPSQAILNKVLEKCSAKTVRPLNDNVSVVGIQQVTYDIELCYYTTVEEESEVVKEIEGDNGAITRFNEWQCEKNGRAINPDRLRAEILKSDTHSIGADYVEITKPSYKVLEGTQVAKWSGKSTITHKTTAPAGEV